MVPVPVVTTGSSVANARNSSSSPPPPRQGPRAGAVEHGTGDHHVARLDPGPPMGGMAGHDLSFLVAHDDTNNHDGAVRSSSESCFGASDELAVGRQSLRPSACRSYLPDRTQDMIMQVPGTMPLLGPGHEYRRGSSIRASMARSGSLRTTGLGRVPSSGRLRPRHPSLSCDCCD
jgi:hypothetical protein